ncbi:hypothetical protein Droror1_Dr00005757 [Drosera rotundifolia]
MYNTGIQAFMTKSMSHGILAFTSHSRQDLSQRRSQHMIQPWTPEPPDPEVVVLEEDDDELELELELPDPAPDPAPPPAPEPLPPSPTPTPAPKPTPMPSLRFKLRPSLATQLDDTMAKVTTISKARTASVFPAAAIVISLEALT